MTIGEYYKLHITLAVLAIVFCGYVAFAYHKMSVIFTAYFALLVVVLTFAVIVLTKNLMKLWKKGAKE